MALERGTLFSPQLVEGLVNQVKGRSSLAKMTAQTPIAFNGNKEFTFTMDKEVDVVAESGAKSHGGISLGTRTVLPIKIEYGARVSDEFLYAAEEEQINILQAFTEGFARKAARGLDLMAFHGVNPRTALPSAVIGTNNFDSQVQGIPLTDADDTIEAAIAAVQAAGHDITGLIMNQALASALGNVRVSPGGAKRYPELAWGANPESINGLRTDINRTVSDMGPENLAYLGDFGGSFRWGYAKEIPMEVIRYGNPDNDPVAGDLKGHNQVYIRCELFLGWSVLAPAAFARIVTAEDGE